jgi:hypothetical protein
MFRVRDKVKWSPKFLTDYVATGPNAVPFMASDRGIIVEIHTRNRYMVAWDTRKWCMAYGRNLLPA